MDRAQLSEWIARYETAWRMPGTGTLRDLFTDDATYSPAPYAEDVLGLEAVAGFWDGERDGPDEVFSMTSEMLATEGDTGVARVELRYGDPVREEYRDLWVVVLDADGRCTHFESGRTSPASRSPGPKRADAPQDGEAAVLRADLTGQTYELDLRAGLR